MRIASSDENCGLSSIESGLQVTNNSTTNCEVGVFSLPLGASYCISLLILLTSFLPVIFSSFLHWGWLASTFWTWICDRGIQIRLLSFRSINSPLQSWLLFIYFFSLFMFIYFFSLFMSVKSMKTPTSSKTSLTVSKLCNLVPIMACNREIVLNSQI